MRNDQEVKLEVVILGLLCSDLYGPIVDHYRNTVVDSNSFYKCKIYQDSARLPQRG